MNTAAPKLTPAEAQQIAQGIVGPITWQDGATGYCVCPGHQAHTTRNTTTDCKVIVETTNSVAPGVYCFHDSCRDAVDAASFALRSALGKGEAARAEKKVKPVRTTLCLPRCEVKADFEPAKLERIARKMDGADYAWFAEKSAKTVHGRAVASVLHELYRPGEKVVIFDVYKSQGQAVWTHTGPPFDAGELDSFTKGKREGTWFLNQPITGEFVPDGTTNPDGTAHMTRRSYRTVTSWRYLVLESDKADPAQWLAMICQMPIPIAAIYSSGGKSIHTLVKVDAESKAEFDELIARISYDMITLGADRKAMTAVRLTRLPCCERLGKMDGEQYVKFPQPALQRLIYLNGSPTCSPICEL